MAHKLVTDEMVEKAVAAEQALWSAPGDGVTSDDCIRAALEAVADDLIEAIALVAEEEADQFRAVQAIRSLKSQGQ